MKKIKNSPVTDQELLSLLDTKEEFEEIVKIPSDNTVLAFISSFNLKPGKEKITKAQLYSLYSKWNNTETKLTVLKFSTEFGKYFEHTRHFYFIDKDMFSIANSIEILKTKNKTYKCKSKKWLKHFETFLRDTGLKEGTNYIELEIINFLYIQWCTKKKKFLNLSRRQLIPFLELFFDTRYISNGYLWIGVNDQIKNLISKSEVDRWRKLREKQKKKDYKPKEEWKKFTLYWEEKEAKEKT